MSHDSKDLRIANVVDRPGRVTINVDGADVPAFAGESVAAALHARGRLVLRTSPKARTPRGAFCLMGICQECAVRIDGAIRQACLVPVHDGMQVHLSVGHVR